MVTEHKHCIPAILWRQKISCSASVSCFVGTASIQEPQGDTEAWELRCGIFFFHKLSGHPLRDGAGIMHAEHVNQNTEEREYGIGEGEKSFELKCSAGH